MQPLAPSSRSRATAQLVAVTAVLGGWLSLSSLTTWIPSIDGAGGTVLHVGLTGAVAILAVLLAMWREPSRRASLGLAAAPWFPSIG